MNRDVNFWKAIAAHRSIAPYILEFDVEAVVSHPRVIPMADEHGGYLFFCLDALGTVFEVHAMITPEGRGRRALALAFWSLEQLFMRGARIIIAHEDCRNAMSLPPRTFGFEPCGEPIVSGGEIYRQWILTKATWFASPARKRLKPCLQH